MNDMSEVLAKWQMRRVTLQDIYDECRELYWSIWGQAKNYGRDVKVYLHWTAGWYGQFWDDYHIQIDQDGSIWMPSDTALDDVLAGTWRRNTGSIQVSLLCCVHANTKSLGPEPPTQKQIETMAMVMAVLSEGLDLTIDTKRMMTHGEAADNEDGLWLHEPYGPKNGCERWDLELLGPDTEAPTFNPWDNDVRGGTVLRGKANWYNDYYDKKVYEYFADGTRQLKKKG